MTRIACSVALIVGACGAKFVAPPLPPISAPPVVVLETYLAAFRAADCALARELWVGTHVVGDGDLCDATRLAAFTVRDPPASPSSGLLVFATTLQTDGTADGTVPSGDITWFFMLALQSDGAWRITGGGSGP